jgi:GPH family glycoside/pentoside/hexuronide:cation symporter
MAACYYFLLAPPPLKSGLFAWFLAFYFLMLTSRKFYETAFGALMPELTLDYDERTKLSTFRQLCGTVGDVSGALLPFGATYLFARGTDFKVTGAVCAITVAGGAMLAYRGLRERTDFFERERSRLLESLKAVLANRPFVILLIATTLAVMAINIPTVLLIYLAQYWYHDENAAARWLMAYFAGSAISYPFWFRITIWIEKKPAFVVAMLCNALGSAMFMLLTPHSRVAIYALMAFTGFSAIGIWVTQISASADVIEWDEVHTGQRQEGAYGGITSMAIKVAIAITLLLVGPVLGWVGYRPGAAGITAAAGENLRLVFSLAPATIYLMSAMVFSRYPITRESHRAMRDRLNARAATAEEEKAKSIA